MEYFGINIKLIGVKNIIIDNKITTKLEKPAPMFEGKVACIKKFIDPEKKPLLGVGDSIYDLPMLKYCKIKIFINIVKNLKTTKKGVKMNLDERGRNPEEEELDELTEADLDDDIEKD